jgi:RNA polymerase sigma-70 factor (ECF subfamily)
VGTVLQLPRPAPDTVADREAALVARARAGDTAAWATLYQEHFDRLFSHITYLTGDPTLAEDLVQESFARAVVALPDYQGRASFVGWLRGIAVNVVRLHWRSRHRGDQAMGRLGVVAELRPPDTASDPEGAHLRQRRAEVLLAVLDTLPEPLREAFVLCDLEDLPAQVAAAELGVTPGNLRVRAARARARIRGELTRLGWLTIPTREETGDEG